MLIKTRLGKCYNKVNFWATHTNYYKPTCKTKSMKKKCTEYKTLSVFSCGLQRVITLLQIRSRFYAGLTTACGGALFIYAELINVHYRAVLNWVTKKLMRRGGLRQSQGLRLDCGRQDGALFPPC